MSTASLILFVISAVFLIWQVVLVGLAFAWVRSGRYNRVHIGMLPLIISAGACIAGILMR